MNASDLPHPDITIHLAGGNARLPGAQLLLVGENLWHKGYSCVPTEGDQSWVALRTLSGKGRCQLSESPPLDVFAGTIVIFRECHLLQYEVTGKQWTTHWYQFDIDAPAILPTNHVLSAPEEANERTTHRDISSGLADASMTNRLRATAQFLQLLFSWIAASGHPPPPLGGSATVEQAILLMQDKLYEGIPISKIAKQIGISGTRLRELFNVSVGVTPKKYFNWMRMYEARRLLVAGENVQRVAARLGYSDQFHFTRAFKSHFNRSPQALVRSARRTGDLRRRASRLLCNHRTNSCTSSWNGVSVATCSDLNEPLKLASIQLGHPPHGAVVSRTHSQIAVRDPNASRSGLDARQDMPFSQPWNPCARLTVWECAIRIEMDGDVVVPMVWIALAGRTALIAKVT